MKRYEKPSVKTYNSSEILEILGPAQGMASGGSGGSISDFECVGGGHSGRGSVKLGR